MASRTTKAAVAGIIELDPNLVPTDAAMDSFLLPANELVTELCVGSAGPTPAYTAARLELIERWLAAHFYTTLDPRASSEKADSASAKYQEKIDVGLAASHYGQMAMRLDTNGGLARMNHNALKGATKIGGFWAGTSGTPKPTTTIVVDDGDDVTIVETSESLQLAQVAGLHLVSVLGTDAKTITLVNPALYSTAELRKSVVEIENVGGGDITIDAAGINSKIKTARNPGGVASVTLNTLATKIRLRCDGTFWIVFTEIM